ncbi:MAG: GIY-YIG nuclease family protein [Candidatus Omnitrophota bacterium]
MLKFKDNSFYVGITNSLSERIKRHIQGRGSTYVKGRSIADVYYEVFPDRKSAREREIQLKNWNREKKERLMSCVSKVFPSTLLFDK